MCKKGPKFTQQGDLVTAVIKTFKKDHITRARNSVTFSRLRPRLLAKISRASPRLCEGEEINNEEH